MIGLVQIHKQLVSRTFTGPRFTHCVWGQNNRVYAHFEFQGSDLWFYDPFLPTTRLSLGDLRIELIDILSDLMRKSI